MPILDVTRNRHLESIGQEIRVRHDFLPYFCLLPFLYIIMVYVSRSQKVYICTEIRNRSNYLLKKTVSPMQCNSITTTSKLVQDFY